MGQLFASLFSPRNSRPAEDPKAAPFLPKGQQQPPNAQLELKRTRDQFTKQEILTNKEMEAWQAKALEAYRAHKEAAALRCMKVKRLKEKQLTTLRDQLYELENLLINIQSAQNNQRFFATLEAGTKLLKDLQSQIPLSKAEQIMDSAAEVTEANAEMEAILSRSLTSDELNADTLIAELEQMSRKAQGGTVPPVQMGAGLNLPVTGASGTVETKADGDSASVLVNLVLPEAPAAIQQPATASSSNTAAAATTATATEAAPQQPTVAAEAMVLPEVPKHELQPATTSNNDRVAVPA